jgi:predicted glycoside hydrolase/deacetylase ChbG (UPF0249 family)
MYKNQANIAKNRMVLTLKGKTEVDELNAWSKDLLAQLKKLKPGFGVISDIMDCHPTTEEGRMIIQDTQKKAKEMGMGHVVRITQSSNVVTALQWQRSSRAIGYTAAEAKTIAEAEALLDEMEK